MKELYQVSTVLAPLAKDLHLGELLFHLPRALDMVGLPTPAELQKPTAAQMPNRAASGISDMPNIKSRYFEQASHAFKIFRFKSELLARQVPALSTKEKKVLVSEGVKDDALATKNTFIGLACSRSRRMLC